MIVGERGGQITKSRVGPDQWRGHLSPDCAAILSVDTGAGDQKVASACIGEDGHGVHIAQHVQGTTGRLLRNVL